MGVDLKIAQLRRMKGVSQQDLAQYLGVTFQSVSKWETKSSMPDITLLPEIANYFEVSVDELLGLIPLQKAKYIARNTDDRTQWKNRKPLIDNNRQFFWNDDYLNFLVNEVWKINHPIDVVEYCCCNAALGKQLMTILPKGSTYTGVDSAYLLEGAKKNLEGAEFNYQLIESNIYEFQPEREYDLSICQTSLRHMNHAKIVLQSMKDSVKDGGLIACMEINREFENVGLYIKGMDYDYLCHAFDWRKLWYKELELEGRDYAIGVRLPFYMKELGLHEVDVRMNDKVTLLTPTDPEYERLRDAFEKVKGWVPGNEFEISGEAADIYLSRGYNREEIECLVKYQNMLKKYFEENAENISLLHYYGMLISYGRK